jgi:beta-glucanase (GH16 family)
MSVDMIQSLLRFILALVAILLFPFQGGAQTNCSHLVWSDEFETAGAPDATKWNFETGGGGWGNNELQNYTATRNNSYVSDGTLKIHAKKSNSTWTSARMVTKGKASWKYGRFEIKAKLPAGRGTWPAIWMMPLQSIYGGWPKSGEIDIMEHVGYDMNRVSGTIHTEAYNHSIGTQKGGNILLTNVDKQFHIYTMEWTETEIKWSADGQQYYSFRNENKTYKEWPFDQLFFLIFNVAIGGSWGGTKGVDTALTEAIMEIDYVRVYRAAITPPVISGPSFVTPGQQVVFSTPQAGQLQYKWSLPEGVAIISGAGTSRITVNWNDKPGEVLAEAYNDCDTVPGTPLKVGMLAKPEGEYWVIPFAGTTGTLLWSTAPGANNQISLAFSNGDLVVTYNIQSPIQNPSIFYSLPITTDLTEYREMLVQLMAQAGQMPGNIRIDLLDVNGNTDSSDLFKIDNSTADGKFYLYQKLFTMNQASGWKTGNIAQVRIFFNYGILGAKGSGEFRIRDLKMHNPNYTSISVFRSPEGVRLFPNPAGDRVEITAFEPFNAVTVTSVSGQVLKRIVSEFVVHQIIPLQELLPGLYVVTLSYKGNHTGNFRMIKE